MKLSKFLLTEITAEILLHPESGVGFELLENTYIVDENVIEVKMHQPVTININSGPFHGEMLTRVQTVLSKTIESEGLDSYHLNATTERYKCENAGLLDCESGWKSFTLG